MDFLFSGRIRGSYVLCLLLVMAMLAVVSDSYAFRWELNNSTGDYGTLPGTTEWYTTLGNNLQVVLHTSGQHLVWVEQKSVLWPRGSGEKLVRYPGLWYGAIGDFSDDEKQDTVARRHSDSAHSPGRLATNFWWREDGKYYEAQADLDADGNPDYPQGALDLKVSIRNDANKGPDAWPPEFREDIDGDGKGDLAGAPIILSDEDVICIHHARWNMRGEFEELDQADGFTGYGGSIPMQFEERIMSFGHPAATDIQFHLVTVRNASRWHFYALNDDPSLGPVNTADQPGLPPTDFNCVMVGQYANTEPGDGPFYAGYQPATRLLFTFDRDFLASGYRASTAFIGIVYLHMPEVDGEEIPMTVATAHLDESCPWHLWTSNRVPTDVGWNMFRGQLNLDRQSPGPNPGGVADPRADSTIYIANWSNSLIHGMAQSDDLVIPPDSAVQFDFAYVASLPINNPVPDNSDAGIVQEAANLVKKTELAYQLYNTGYRLPKAPAAPNLKIIPGDRKVTLTWDDVPVKTPDPFLPADDPSQGFRQYDFEGFRVYRSRTGQIDDAELLAQYDLKNGITLETGISNRMIEVIDADGNSQILESPAVQDTAGASALDAQKRYGLGSDTGLKFTYVDQWDEPSTFQRLTNGFRYFYMVTSYDWNQGESLESSLVFTEENMTVPRSDANTYMEASADISSTVLYDGAGNELDPLASTSAQVEMGVIQSEAVPTNSFANPVVEVSNAELITAESEYKIKVDSIVGGPGPTENHLLDPAFDYFAWQTIYVSLLDPNGNVVGTALDQMKIDLEETAVMGDVESAHFYINPSPDSSMGVPFAVEFELQPFDFQYMQVNPVEILVGAQELGGDFIEAGFNNGNQNIPAGFRAADFEIDFVAVGDSVTMVVKDITHNVDVPFMDYPGAGWCFYGSWSRFTRLMREQFREDLTYDDIYDGGPKISRTIPNYGAGEYPLSSSERVYIHLCGLKMELKSEYPPKAGDKWLVRTNYGELPAAAEDGTVSGDFSPVSPRPPVSGVSYAVNLIPADDSESNRDMSRIKVVPNPFIVSTPWDQSPLSKQIQFTHLPAHAEVRIYTLSGHLVQVLQHDGVTGSYDRDWQGGTVNWNLQNRFNSQIASGWYIWHCKDLDTGEVEMGKFAVIQ